ncbi:MAG: hypothetical protein EP329_13340 [Deltaproteobacteria bacterium]|nr:MAG: hypothetical protein EP329_13340 [Deltaproteobacteria bacterium]
MPKLALTTALLLLLTAAAYAQPGPPQLDKEYGVSALGGAKIKAPAWNAVRTDEAVLVLEQAPDPAQKRPFYVLMLAIEEGPPAGAEVPWDKIKDNIIKAATDEGRSLSLTLGDPWKGAAGFDGLYMSGSFKGSDEQQQQVGLELIALVKDGKLLTVSLVSDAVVPDTTTKILEAIAATAALGG